MPNDWQIKKCLKLSLSLLVAMLGLIGLASLGCDVPVLRPIVGFVFLTFIPGVLILRILKIHNLDLIESPLYTVGLSIASVMTVGVVVNLALPLLGISRPLSVLPLTGALTIFILILCWLAYKRDRDSHPSNRPREEDEIEAKPSLATTVNPLLLAVSLPLLAVLSTKLVNYYHNNSVLLVLIFAIVTLVALVVFSKFVPPRVYPLMIVMMAIALVYQTTLISDYLVGSDIHLEYYFANLTLKNGYWDATIFSLINSCLSTVILAPIYSLLLNMDIIWLFKIIYPLFFSLLPLALFRTLSLQIRPRYAFIATFFFISTPMFFMDLAQLTRQQISELFFILVILLMVDRKLTLVQRTALVLIFSFGTVVSYYGMGTGYVIGYLPFGVLMLIILKSRPGRNLWQWLIGKSNSLPDDLTSAGALTKKVLAFVVGAGLIFAFAYYALVASGAGLSGFRVAADVGKLTGEQVIQGIAAPPVGETPTGGAPTPKLPNFIKDIITRFP
ncbi:MAG: hypothetical protein V1894_05000, partial [Chloroflexota bacterium]